MPQSVNVSSPSTVYVKFTGSLPRLFVLYDGQEVHYFRYLDGKTPRIKFRMPVPGLYNSDNDFEIVKTVPVEIPDDLPSLPPAERDRWKGINVTYDPELMFTASIDTNAGTIYVGKKFRSLIKPVQIFIIEHEKGHFFYETEEKCDLFALVNFIRMGYNESTAYFALANVIRRSPQQMQRVRELFNQISVVHPNFNPGI